MNIEDLKDEVSILDVLGHYGAETWHASYHGHGWTPINCPFCGDTNGSGSVNKKLWPATHIALLARHSASTTPTTTIN